jgi:hypothetical protein
MARKHGVTANTFKRFVIDAGEVRQNFTSVASPGTLLGATRGGSTFTVETEYKEMAVDGAKGPVKGGRRIAKVTARLTANFVEWNTALIKASLPGSTHGVTGVHDLIGRSLQLGTSDYLSNVVIIGDLSDAGATGPVILKIDNAIADGNVEHTLTDNEEAVVKVQFTGHFDPTNLDAEPWKVYWPTSSNG